MYPSLPRSIVPALLLATALHAGCNTNDICTGDQCDSPSDGDGGITDPTLAQIQSLVLDPLDPSLLSTDGSRPTQGFTVRGRLPDGTLTGPLKGLWSATTSAIGAVGSSDGVFTATGEAGGSVRVRVEVARVAGALQADTGLTVLIKRQVIVPGPNPDPGSLFKTPPVVDNARAAGIAYPLAKAVMPQNVFPANVQWLNGVAGDVFRVTIKKPSVEVVAYVQHTGAAFTNSWLVEQKAWRAVAQSDGDQATADISVDRYEAATKQVISGAAVSIRLIKAALQGSIYYWDIAAGRILRIDDGTANRVAFMPAPPAAPVGGDRCIGCHGVSRDGRFMVGRLGGGDNPGTVFDLTRDLTPNPAPSLFPVDVNSVRWGFATFSPDNTRLLTSAFATPPGPLQLVDAKSGARLTPKTGALPAGTYPSWSPDGKAIAYGGAANDWGGELTFANLTVMPVTGADSFGAPVDIVKSDAQSPALGYPTWTPDSKWLAFFRGAKARSDDGSGALFLVSPTGGQLTRLDNANGGAAGNNNFVPNFSPFDSGGYYWLMFLSKRDYGNAQAGTRGAARQQLWVTAISNSPKAGVDPSEVAYWLPGQATTSQNISGYWAPKACRKDNEVCSVGSECCGGLCVANKCQPPPVDMCRTEGQTCGGGGCCAGLLCDDRTHVCGGTLG